MGKEDYVLLLGIMAITFAFCMGISAGKIAMADDRGADLRAPAEQAIGVKGDRHPDGSFDNCNPDTATLDRTHSLTR